MITIKYLSGNKNGQTAEVEDVRAKSLIEDGLAEEVKPADPMEVALKGFEDKANEIASKVMADASAKAVDSFSKGLSRASSIRVGDDLSLQDPQGGFKCFSHFLLEVKRSGSTGPESERMSNPTPAIKKWIETSKRIEQAANYGIKSAYVPVGNEEGTSDASATVPVQYLTEIFKMYGNQPSFMDSCFPVPMQTAFARIPILKNYARNNTTGTLGVVPTIPGEAAAIPVSNTVWEQLSLTLSKESIVVPVSNELLEDNNVALGNVVAGQAAWQINKSINGGILVGSGNGSSGGTNLASSACTGIIGHASTKVVTRATSGTITFADILNMYAGFAFDDADYDNAVWFAHPTALPIIAGITSGNYNVFTAPGGLGDLSVARLMGRPIINTGWCNPVGTVGAGFQDNGDLLLVDLKKYVMGYKGGLNSFVSPHVFAVSDQTGFRFTMRINGKPGLSGKITLEDGVTTVSPFVQLGVTAASS